MEKTTQHPIRPLSCSAIFQAYLGSLPCPACWKDTTAQLRGANQRFLDLFGLHGEADAVGLLETDFLPSQNAQELAKLDHAIINGHETIPDVEIEVELPNGAQATLLTNRSPMRDAYGEVVGVLIIFTDVTQDRHNQRQIAAHQRELEERNQMMEQDLDSAQQIQQFLVGGKAQACDFLDIQFRYRYMEKVGGDYLSFRSIDAHSYSFMLADLTGHGVTAALFMALLKYISQESPEEVRSLPAYFLSYLDMEFFGQIPNGFFTAFAATLRLEPDSGSVVLEYSNAAHPRAIVIRADGSCLKLEPGDFAVGLLDFVERSSQGLELRLGDRLFVYTDGFLETVNEQDEEYGLERLCRSLQASRPLSLTEAIDAAYADLDAFSCTGEPQDDTTIVGLEVRVPTPHEEVSADSEDIWGFN